ncbi:MAG: hypothetical protein ACRDJE_18270 [Dehalococcoidia bacterium]
MTSRAEMAAIEEEQVMTEQMEQPNRSTRPPGETTGSAYRPGA